jgi:hypothetical protein
MSPLWPDFALARVAWAKAECDGSVSGGKGTLSAVERPTKVSRPVRRVLHVPVESFAL